MNDTLWKIKRQAWYEAGHLGDDEFFEKIVELTVRECILICKSHKIQSTEDVWYLAHNETVNNISENIEEYFGVEE